MPPDTPNASLIPLPESSNCSLSETMETASPGHSRDRGSEKHPPCISCKSLCSMVTVMMEKMNGMQCQLDAQSKLLRQNLGPSMLAATIRKQFNNITSLVSKYPSTIESQIPEIQFNRCTFRLQLITAQTAQLQNNNPTPTINQSTPTPSTSPNHITHHLPPESQLV